jgi:hypothetical protein
MVWLSSVKADGQRILRQKDATANTPKHHPTKGNLRRTDTSRLRYVICCHMSYGRSITEDDMNMNRPSRRHPAAAAEYYYYTSSSHLNSI